MISEKHCRTKAPNSKAPSKDARRLICRFKFPLRERVELGAAWKIDLIPVSSSRNSPPSTSRFLFSCRPDTPQRSRRWKVEAGRKLSWSPYDEQLVVAGARPFLCRDLWSWMRGTGPAWCRADCVARVECALQNWPG